MSGLSPGINLSPSIFNYPTTGVANNSANSSKPNTSIYNLTIGDLVNVPYLLADPLKPLNVIKHLNAGLSSIEAVLAQIGALGTRGNTPELKKHVESMSKLKDYFISRIKSAQENLTQIEGDRSNLNEVVRTLSQNTRFNSGGTA